MVDPFLTRNCMRVASTRPTYDTTGPVRTFLAVATIMGGGDLSPACPTARAKTQGPRADGARVDRLTRSSSFAEAELEDRTRNERRNERRAEPAGCARRRAGR